MSRLKKDKNMKEIFGDIEIPKEDINKELQIIIILILILLFVMGIYYIFVR